MGGRFFIPVLVFMAVAVFFAIGLSLDPSKLPSALIDQPAPVFDLPGIEGVAREGFSSNDLGGRVVLVNIFASWCLPCLAEHPQITALSRDHKIPVFAINKKDKPGNAAKWLEKNGNPYPRIGADNSGRVSVDWGVYGVPETFIVDKQKRIRYRHVGPIMPHDMKETILPLVEELSQ